MGCAKVIALGASTHHEGKPLVAKALTTQLWSRPSMRYCFIDIIDSVCVIYKTRNPKSMILWPSVKVYIAILDAKNQKAIETQNVLFLF